MVWTQERVDTLTQLWQKGLSASQISAQLGEGISRNAVIGKIHRLGLNGRPVSVPKVAQLGTADKSLAVAPTPKDKDFLKTLNGMEAEEVTNIGSYTRLVDLPQNGCRWPIGDIKKESFRFCGTKKIAGRSYCEKHTAIAYPPQRKRTGKTKTQNAELAWQNKKVNF